MPLTTHDSPEAAEAPEVLDRREGPYGEVVLRRHGTLLQIIANGYFLMDTSDGRSERRLVDAAADALAASGGRTAPHLLIGGLGVGFSLAHAAADPRWGRIAVVEREGAIIDWHRTGPLAALSADALADPRAEIVEADLVEYVNETSDTYDALCLDIDNGPGWTVTEGNDGLYAPSGLAGCARLLRPGGVLAVWSAQPSPEFEETLRNAGFQQVRTEEIPVARGVPDVVHIGVGPG
ncbi:spermidine synthase family protein [Streptomyces anthocyanicus]|uniref:spermidine synthase n=1 Tax=Streptomyces anthocyanicus TaxID=68174 RepID=UPI00384CE34C